MIPHGCHKIGIQALGIQSTRVKIYALVVLCRFLPQSCCLQKDKEKSELNDRKVPEEEPSGGLFQYYKSNFEIFVGVYTQLWEGRDRKIKVIFGSKASSRAASATRESLSPNKQVNKPTNCGVQQ